MTAQRKIEPELRSIPLTFMDCPYNGYNIDLPFRLNNDYTACYYCVIVGYADGTKQDCPTVCKIYRDIKNCPRGFP